MPLPIGSYVGRIRIDALLGAGGMGEVYRGWDEKLERAVALKSITAERRLSPALRARFLREARVLSRLDHPNICRIWDVLELVDGDWLVLELIEGPTLRERIEKGLPRQEAIEIALQIARVLSVAHGRGIIHRDLKPENVMQTADGDVKVLDFGLARTVEAEYADPVTVEAQPVDVEKTLIIGEESTVPDDSRTSAGSLVGTLHYMSPEQARALPLTPASDIYSLGVMLHEMLGDGSAYGEIDSAAELLQRVRAGAVVKLPVRDGRLQRLVSHMTSLQPADRPAAGEVADELARLAARPQRRRALLIAAAAVAATIIAGVGGVMAVRRFAEAGRVFGKQSGSRVAILPFRNATGDRGMQWVEVGLMDQVVRGLNGVRGVDVIDSDTVVKSLKHLRLPSGVDLSSSDRARLLEAIGADAVIASSVSLRDGRYTIRYVAYDRRRSEAPQEASSPLITEAANQMSDRLAERMDPATHLHGFRATHDTFAAIAYDIGRQIELTRGGKYAESYYEVAIDRDPEFLDAKQRLADNYAREGRFADAQPLMDAALAGARKQNRLDLLSTGLVNVAYWNYARGDGVSQERYAREALAVAQRTGDARLIGYAQNALGIALLSLNRVDDAERLLVESLEIARRLRNPADQLARVNNLGMIAVRRNQPANAKKWLEEAMRLAQQTGYRDMLVTVVGNLAIVYGDAGDLARADEMSARQVQLAQELGDKRTEIEGMGNRALWAYARGNEDEAIALTEQARVAAAEFGAPQLEALLLSNLAQARARRGELAAAKRDADAALAVDAKVRTPELEPDIFAGVAYVATRSGRLADAQRWLDRADALRTTTRVVIFRARLLYAQHEYADALATIEKAKAVGELWFPQYEAMRRAFAESAKTGRESTIAFEEPLK